MSTHRTYKNGQLTDGFDMEGLFNNLGKQPKMILKTYNPITNKKKTLSNRDLKKLFQTSSSNSLKTNLKKLLKKSKKTRQRKSGTKRRHKQNKSRKRN